MDIVVKHTIKFTIGKVALLIKRSKQTIMTWERQGKIPHSHREKSSNYRYWTPQEVQQIIDWSSQ